MIHTYKLDEDAVGNTQYVVGYYYLTNDGAGDGDVYDMWQQLAKFGTLTDAIRFVNYLNGGQGKEFYVAGQL